MNFRNFALFAALLALASAPALAFRAPPQMPRPPIPADAIVLVAGAPVTFEGTLTVQNLEGRHAFATNFTHPLYQRHAARYPMVHRPGFMPHPRFIYTRVESQMLTSGAGHDLVALAKLVGPGARVTLGGVYKNSPRTMSMVVQVTKVELRGLDVPVTLPSIQRLIASAKAAVRERLATFRTPLTAASMTAHHLGALRVRVDATVRGGATWSFVYDGLSGDVASYGQPE